MMIREQNEIAREKCIFLDKMQIIAYYEKSTQNQNPNFIITQVVFDMYIYQDVSITFCIPTFWSTCIF